MSLSGSSDSRCRSCATTRLAIVSSMGVPRKMIRSLASASRCRTSARRARSARSPSESHGSRSCGLLAAGGPQLRVGFRLFLVRGPELFSRIRDFGRNRLHVGREALERRAQAEVLANRLLLAVRPHVLHKRVSVLSRLLGLFAQVCLDLVLRDLDPRSIGER